MSAENNCGCECSTYVPWLDASPSEIEKKQRAAAELERRAERRVTQGRLAMYLSDSVVRDDIFKLCGISSDVELMSLIVDEIECSE